MMTFRDNQKLINIRMMTIYFMLSEQERTQHKEVIDKFNRSMAFTLGLYEFKILTKLGGVNSCLSEDVKTHIEANNMIVRLPNDANDNFVYAFGNVNLTQNINSIERHLHNYVIELTEQSIELLKARQETNMDGSELSSQLDNIIYSLEEGIKSGKISYTQRTTPQEIKDRHLEGDYSFNMIGGYLNTTISNDKKAVTDTNKIPDDAVFGTTWIQHNLDEGTALDFGRVLSCLSRHDIPESKQHLVAKELTEIFAEMFGIPTKEESKAIAKGILNEDSDAIYIDNCERKKPNEKPDLKIYIEHIPYIDGRGNKKREKYGIRISVGSFEKKIIFEDATQRMIYIAALLRHKMGKRLYVHELRNNSYGKTVDREVAKQWLKKIFKTIIKPEDSEFEKWMDSVSCAQNKGAKLNTATSSTKRIIKENLEMCPDALHYCLLKSVPRAADGTYYTFNCSPDDIVVCGELQEAIKSVAGMY